MAAKRRKATARNIIMICDGWPDKNIKLMS